MELAGQVRELATRSLRGEFRSFDPSSVRVILLDGGKEPLANFGDQLAGKATKELEHLGVELRMGARVVGVDASGVDISDGEGNSSRLPTYTTVWAAGVEASPLAKELATAAGARLDRAGRIMVEPDLTLPGHPEVFVVGDMMALDKLPGVAEVAMQGGLHAANTIVRRLKDKPAVPFTYRDLGSAATIGRFRSVVNFKGLRLSGLLNYFQISPSQGQRGQRKELLFNIPGLWLACTGGPGRHGWAAPGRAGGCAGYPGGLPGGLPGGG